MRVLFALGWGFALGTVSPLLAVRAPEATRTERAQGIGGLRPAPTDFSHLAPAQRAHRLRRGAGPRLASGALPLPSTWDSRDHGWVTPVRSQGDYGTCWTFSTCAALETAFLRTSAVTNDFSENHLAAHNVGFTWGYDDGGNNQIAAALLLAWRDPLDETDDPYGHPDSAVALPPRFHVQNIIQLPERTVTHASDAARVAEANEILQRAVQTYGAVSIGYTHSDDGFNESTGAHYYQTGMTSAGGHAVTLIGWDDDYSTNNFVAAYRPPANGAFLVKNSWGTYRGDGGYAWISYYDDGLCRQVSAAYPQPEATNNYGRVYQYDPCGQINTWNVYLDAADEATGGKTNWCANVFTSVATGIVEAVGFYALSYDTSYEIRVYAGCGVTPSSGRLVCTQSGVVAEPGYATIRLATPVPVQALEKFAVAVNLETPDYAYPIPVESSYAGYCTATAHAGESFLSPDGVNWTDFQIFPDSSGTDNVCVKAYTRFGADGPVEQPRMAGEIWVDATAGSAGADGSAEHPFPTLTDALVDVVSNDVVWVRPGVYEGTVMVPAVPIEIRSTDGPETTILEPGPDGTCCYYGYGNPLTLLAGFTLRGGSCQYGGGALYGTLSNCVITACVADYGGGASGATLLHCTVIGNTAYGAGSGVDANCVCSNSIIWANYNASGSLDNWRRYRKSGSLIVPTMAWCCTTPSGYRDATGCFADDPLLADEEGGDWRLREGSPCLGAASDGGNIGAWQGAGVKGYTLTAEAVGGGCVTPASAFVLEGGSATFTASDDHPFVRFETNGVFASEASVFTWSDVRSDGTVRAVFSPTDFHVDAATGDDAANGWSAATAKRTLQAAVDVATSGETISVRPGTYGGIVVPTAKTNLCIVSTDGAGATFLDGGGTTRCLDDYATTYLEGFTLTRGAAENDYGGGAYCGTLVNCVISNCTATVGGGAVGASLWNCLVLGNSAQFGGGAYECLLANCTVVANHATRFGGGAYLDQGMAVNTIVATNVCTRGYDYGNDVYGNGYWTMICSSSDVDVKFVDAARGDYRLALDSPCLNAGTNVYVQDAIDLDGRPRIVGRTVDQGAFERDLAVEGWMDPQVTSADTPQSESAKVAQALRDQGFAASTATAVETLVDYARLGNWANEKGVSKASLAAASLPLLSAALGCDGLLDYQAEDVSITGLERTDAGWRLSIPVSDCVPSRVCPSLLRSAVDLLQAETPAGPYAPAVSPVGIVPEDARIGVTVTPATETHRAFYKVRLR